ncbi:class I SAM-dependent methyltransferase [Candidatus Woesearchaeota archaeon]|nr:class I SAM-dependent methyltransferase [Candidatus Woesearchaeota archaeon]
MITEKLINSIFKNTNIFYSFRNLVHNNFTKEKLILRKELDKNKKTLDFGCGIGQYSYLFNNYVGVDIEKDNIIFAKRKFKKDFRLIKNVSDIKNEKFDQIFSTMTFHHINNKELFGIFNFLSKILSKNGRLLIIDHLNVKSQKSLIGKVMLANDRGKYPRNITQLKPIFDKYFKIEKYYYYKTGPYNDYILILNKK